MKKPTLKYPLPDYVRQKFLSMLGDQSNNAGCWNWPKCSPQGYPYMCFDGKSYSAAEVSFLLHIGPIPLGLKAVRKCRNHGCVRPDHLEAGHPNATTEENIHQSFSRKAIRGTSIDKGFTTTTLTLGDIKDVSSLAHKLKSKKCPLSAYIFDRFSEDGQRVMCENQGNDMYSLCTLRRTLVLELNEIIRGELINDCDRFVGIKLRDATLNLLRGNLPITDLGTLNRRLLEDAFVEEISRECFDKPCLEWNGTQSKAGYGVFRYHGPRSVASRVAWALATGDDVPKDLKVLHHCDNPACIEITHLFLGTTQDNILDRKLKGRTAKGAAHGTNTKPESVRRGEQHGNSVLTEDEAILIRRTYDAYPGVKGVISGLTRYLNKKPYAVWCVAKRKTWNHLLDTEKPEIKPLPLEAILNFPKNYAKGERHYGCKLSDLQVREIRLLAAQSKGMQGMTAALATRFSVSRRLIRGIIHRQKRSEVPDNFHELGLLEPLFP
jgi:hypothetical protein